MAPLAKNDIYGSLFFYLREVLLRFCHQIGRLNVSIELFQVPLLQLPSIIKEYGLGRCSFDRIHVRSPTLIFDFALRFGPSDVTSINV